MVKIASTRKSPAACPVQGDSVLTTPVLGDPVLGDHVLGDHVLTTTVLAKPVLGDPILADPVGSGQVGLASSTLQRWREAQVIDYGAILIVRSGRCCIRVNFSEWELAAGDVLIVFPNDLLLLRSASDDFLAEHLRYGAALLREASLQLEQTVYSALRADRCRQSSPVLCAIINAMFSLLRIYFEQSECACLELLVLQQVKSFFIGFHDYQQRNPLAVPGLAGSARTRELFNQFMMRLESDYKQSREVAWYAGKLHITPKYLTNIVRTMTGHTPKVIIDHYVVLQLRAQLRIGRKSVGELAAEFGFSDESFFCRYYRRHTGRSPLQDV